MKRILKINTNDRRNQKYVDAIKKYKKYKPEFDDRFTILKTSTKSSPGFEVQLIGFDGTIKKRYKTFAPTKIIKDIDNMKMGYLRKSNIKNYKIIY